MSSLPVHLEPRAVDDLKGLSVVLRPAVLEQLTRLGANHATCSRPTAFPRPPGLESCLWCRHPDGRAALAEILFRLEVEPDRIVVRRVVVRELDRLPGWVANPSEWPDADPWPVVDL